MLDLIRIKTLSDAGVPLARIEEVLNARPERFAEAIARIDEALEQQARELERRRQRIADLAAGDQLFLPAEFVEYLDQLRAAGVSARTVQAERDGWVLLLAAHAEQAHEMLREKRASLADPAFQQLYRGFDEAFEWDPADPRLEELAEAMVRFVTERSSSGYSGERGDRGSHPPRAALRALHGGLVAGAGASERALRGEAAGARTAGSRRLGLGGRLARGHRPRSAGWPRGAEGAEGWSPHGGGGCVGRLGTASMKGGGCVGTWERHP